MDVIGIIGVACGSVAVPLSSASIATSVVAISQGTSAQQQGGGGGGGGGKEEDLKNDPRLAKFTLEVRCSDYKNVEQDVRDDVHCKRVVLREGRLFIDDPDPSFKTFPDGHAFSGFYIDYPSPDKHRGLVSTIKPDPPELNWIFVDAQTHQLRYGNKTASINHLYGPWDWTENQKCIVLEGWAGFVGVEEAEGVWGLYFDSDEDFLEGVKKRVKALRGKRVVEVDLLRRILKTPKENK